MNNPTGPRIAIVSGLRTPFAKQGTAFKDLSAMDLGQIVVKELLQRSGIAAREVQRVVYGQVIPSPRVPNIAREVALGSGLSPRIDAYSVARACATSYQTTVDIAEAILTGTIDCGIAGGAESASDVPITVSQPLAQAIVQAHKAHSLSDRLNAFKDLKPSDFVPEPPALKEPSSDLTMGESAEKMAKENGISRQAQDEFAHHSHLKAATAWQQGVFDDQVMPVYLPPRYSVFGEDNLIVKDSRPENYAELSPAFDSRHGTVTAGNSSPLTDGASALLLMREDKAKALGLDILGFIRGYAFAALDPNWQMLMGPSFATPLALEGAGITLEDVDLVDMHEAFSAQILSNLQAFESREFARTHLDRDQAIGRIDQERLNVSGGSIALGHPFAATGARQILQLLHDLRRRGEQLGLCTACAAGGLGAAMVLEATS